MYKKISESRDAFECEVLISIFISHLFRSLSHHRKNLKAYFPLSDTSDKLFCFLMYRINFPQYSYVNMVLNHRFS